MTHEEAPSGFVPPLVLETRLANERYKLLEVRANENRPASLLKPNVPDGVPVTNRVAP